MYGGLDRFISSLNIKTLFCCVQFLALDQWRPRLLGHMGGSVTSVKWAAGGQGGAAAPTATGAELHEMDRKLTHEHEDTLGLHIFVQHDPRLMRWNQM